MMADSRQLQPEATTPSLPLGSLLLMMTGIGIQLFLSGWAGLILLLIGFYGMFADSNPPPVVSGLVPEFPEKSQIRWVQVTTAEIDRLEEKLARVEKFVNQNGGCWAWIKGVLGNVVFFGFGLFLLSVGVAWLAQYDSLITADESLSLGGILFGDLVTMFVLYSWQGGRSIPRIWTPQVVVSKFPEFKKIVAMVEKETGGQWETAYQLALSVTRSGEVPVDLKLHLRPADSPRDLIGIQCQMSLNRGSPYAYFVIMARDTLTIPQPTDSGNDVLEARSEKGVNLLVVRQFADRNGGYITSRNDIMRLFDAVRASIKELTAKEPKK